MSRQVLIAGGGLGGLCLAQALHLAGIGVQVFERDASVGARGQGYRIRLTPEGGDALEKCLPPHLYALVQATSSQPSPPPVGAYDTQMNLFYRIEGGAGSPAKPNAHQAVNRRTLRQVLLGGLEEIVQFRDAVIGFSQDENGVEVNFASGRTVQGDVLVAADGISSTVRRQLLPLAEILETDMRCIYGATPLGNGFDEELPEALHAGFTPIIGPDRCTLALGPFRAQRPAQVAAAELAPGVQIDPIPDYLMWMFVAPKDTMPSADASPQTLHQHVLDRIRDWHPDLRQIIERADVPATFPIAIRSACPVPPWPTSRVTLLGDAIHAMTPAGGIGANTALRDAAELARALTSVDNGQRGLIDAISQYEAAMWDYGFSAVARSLQAAASLYRVTVPPMEVSQ